MASKRFEEPGLRAFWAVHIEAWRASGLSRRAYCRAHGLTPATFNRWLGAIGDADALQHKALRKRRRRRPRFRRDIHNKAVQAFWAMHVEAQHWSGLSASQYARAHRLTPATLRAWGQRLDAESLEVDWRELVHPSARPYVGVRRSPSAKAGDAESGLTPRPTHDGRANRRTFTDAQKLAMVLEAEAPGVTVSQVARRRGIVTSMLFRWRAQFGFGRTERARFAEIRLGEAGEGRGGKVATKAHLLETLLPVPEGAVAVELADGRRVFAPPGSDPQAVRRYVAERERARC